DAGEGPLVAGVLDQAGLLEVLDTHADELGRDRQVVNPAAGDAELLVHRLELRLELPVGPGVIETARNEEEGAGEVGPVVVVERLARKAADAVLGTGAEELI